jgi:hypothetical protein
MSIQCSISRFLTGASRRGLACPEPQKVSTSAPQFPLAILWKKMWKIMLESPEIYRLPTATFASQID